MRERVTITLPEDVIEAVDQRSKNRSRFVLDAVRMYLDHLRREELKTSLENVHPDSRDIAPDDFAEWIAAGEADGDLVDPHAGRSVRWRPGRGW